MPDIVTPDPLAAGNPAFADATKNNAEIAAKQAAQDAAGQSFAGNPQDYHAASDAIDAIAATMQPKEPPKPEPVVDEAAKKAADEAAAKAAEEAEAKKVADAEQVKKADDYFKDAPSLPAGASPKSAEAFATVKLRAAQEITAREQKLAELQAKYEELEKKSKTPPEELTQAQKELEDLRAWRAKLDVDFDPKFKSFDKTVSESNEFIYAQLKKSPVITDAVIDEIKKFGGPANCNLTKVFEAVKDPVLQRLVESKIADITMTQYNKEQAIKAAKENITQYTQQRQQELQKFSTSHVEETQQHLNAMLPKFEWFSEQKPDANAKPEELKAAEEHNKFLADMKNQIGESLRDDSPQMRAILVTGLAKLFWLQRQDSIRTAELTTLKKEHAELSAKWEKVKAASVNRSRESNAPANAAPVKPATLPIGTRANEALDELMKGVMEKRAAAATAA